MIGRSGSEVSDMRRVFDAFPYRTEGENFFCEFPKKWTKASGSHISVSESVTAVGPQFDGDLWVLLG